MHRTSPAIVAALCFLAGTLAPSLAAEGSFGQLRLSVLDAAGARLACNVSLEDSSGKIDVENRSFTAGIRCDGRLTRRLPSGKTRVRVSRGFEYRAVEKVVEMPSGGDVELKVQLERIVDLRKRGWYAGENHAHMNHGEKTIPVDFDYVALSARAEDLQYLSLAQAWSIEKPTPENLEAELVKRSTEDCLLTWNLEAPKNYYLGDAGRCLGHCWTLGVKGRTPEGLDVIDTLLKASAHDYESSKPSYANFESHGLIHSQGGAVSYTHPARWWTGSWGGQGGYPKRENMRVSNMAVELPLDTLLGPTFDGVDLITGPGEFEANAMAFELWSLLLNHGYRVAGTASSDACFDRVGGAIPGVARLYTFIEGPFLVAKAVRAVVQGRTFVTTGPLLLVSLDGQPPGTVAAADGKAHQLKIEAWSSGTEREGLSRFELICNGKPVQTHNLSGVQSISTNITLNPSQSSWYCVRVFGHDAKRQRAISGAFFLDAQPHQAPTPLESEVHVILQDATTGEKLKGSLTELNFLGTVPSPARQHACAGGELTLRVPGNVRLRADVSGYTPQIKSLFFDNPALLEYITNLSAEDLLEWKTFERVRALASRTTITFSLKKGQAERGTP